MRVFVAGATGAVGRRFVPRLVRAGHSVIGLTRTPSKAGLLRELGAEPVVADALDERSIRAAVVAGRPDVIVHELTRSERRVGPAQVRSRLRKQQSSAHDGNRPSARRGA